MTQAADNRDTPIGYAPTMETVRIGGIKLVTSGTWGMLSGLKSDLDREHSPIVRTQNTRPFVWVVCRMTNELAMWRWRGGELKVLVNANERQEEIIELQQLGQINIVKEAEFDRITKAMEACTKTQEADMLETIERNMDDRERRIRNVVANEALKIRADLRRRLKEVDAGVVHIGFRFNPDSSLTRREQKRVFVFGLTMRSFSDERLLSACRNAGIELQCAGDHQNLSFWVHRAADELYRGEVKFS